MTTQAATPRIHSLKEYLRFTAENDGKFEFHEGEIIDMAGGTYKHARIAMNTAFAIEKRLQKGPCHTLGPDLRIRINRQLRYLYPDLSVVCGEAVFDQDDATESTIVNPRVVVEVLSDSTEKYNRGLKFELFRELESLKEYVLISHHEPLVEVYSRRSDGLWSIDFANGVSAKAQMTSLKITVPLREIYRGVKFKAKQRQVPEAKKD